MLFTGRNSNEVASYFGGVFLRGVNTILGLLSSAFLLCRNHSAPCPFGTDSHYNNRRPIPLPIIRPTRLARCQYSASAPSSMSLWTTTSSCSATSSAGCRHKYSTRPSGSSTATGAPRRGMRYRRPATLGLTTSRNPSRRSCACSVGVRTRRTIASARRATLPRGSSQSSTRRPSAANHVRHDHHVFTRRGVELCDPPRQYTRLYAKGFAARCAHRSEDTLGFRDRCSGLRVASSKRALIPGDRAVASCIENAE